MLKKSENHRYRILRHFYIVFVQKSPVFTLFIDLKKFQKLTTLALKSLGLTTVPVQVRPAAPKIGVKSSGFTPIFFVWGMIGERFSPFFAIFLPFLPDFKRLLGVFVIFSQFIINFVNFTE